MKTQIKVISAPLLFFISFLIGFGCDDGITKYSPPDNEHKVTISQGVWGNVWFWEGDFMPTPDNSSSGKITAVQREVYVHEATKKDMVDPQHGTFFAKVNSKLIAIVTSDHDGFFQITLEPGKYSFFVKEDTSFYANGTDGEGHILPAEVIKNNATKRQIDITYKATY
jgi:hypothetical protein